MATVRGTVRPGRKDMSVPVLLTLPLLVLGGDTGGHEDVHDLDEVPPLTELATLVSFPRHPRTPRSETRKRA